MILTTLICVAVMLLYAVPGFLLVKTKLVKSTSIPAFAVFLMYVCQPCITLYTFQRVDFSIKVLGNIGIVFILAFVVISVILLGFFILFRKKYDDVRYRIGNISVCFGNCTFFGLPLLEVLLPGNTEVAIHSTAFFMAMNIIGWTVGSALIAQDRKYMKPLKIVLNPAILSLFVALPLFVFKIKFPEQLNNAFTLMGRMSTPICMVIMGMRLATVNIKELFCDKMSYLSCIVKQVLMPVIAFAFVYLLPIDHNVKISFYVMCSCPVAAIVLTFSEMIGKGQKNAANTVLLSTITSIFTLPCMLLLTRFL